MTDLSTFHNPCGGLRWRMVSDGAIEVEGLGIPRAASGSRTQHLIGQTWENWKREFRQAGKEFGIPPAMLAAIAYVETGMVADNPALQARIASQDGFYSIGIMQPIPSTTRMLGFRLEDRFDPLQNIRMGAKLARMNADQYGLDFPLLAASHNAGSVKCRPGENQWAIHTYGNYLGIALPAYNTLLIDFGADRLPLLSGLPLLQLAAGAALGLGLAVGVTYVLAPPRRHAA